MKCQHLALCGGCSLQHVDYAEQLKLKEQSIKDLFKDTPIDPIISCASPWEYRNKMEFSFSQDKAGNHYLGLMLKRGRGRVLDIEQCHLAPLWMSEMLQAVRTWWKESGIAAYRPYRDEGALRTLILRGGKRTGDKMVMLTVSGNALFALKRNEIDSFVKAVQALQPHASIFLRIQQIAKKMPTQFYEMHLAGEDHIREQLFIDSQTLNFKISPTSFFQPNTAQAEVLYSTALQMVSMKEMSLVLDLYCGTGTLGMIAALHAKKVIGIEINPHAIFDAISNKQANGISNFELICGDVGKVLEELKIQFPDLILLDPPRPGLDPLALKQVISLAPKEILYISCNPKTQVNDIQEFQKVGYQIIRIQPLDQFAHTLHIENIVLLKKM